MQIVGQPRQFILRTTDQEVNGRQVDTCFLAEGLHSICFALCRGDAVVLDLIQPKHDRGLPTPGLQSAHLRLEKTFHGFKDIDLRCP
ncbi:hypothetical protein BH20VER3_BH20VER3_02530 [soil metagenome]